MHSRSPRPWLVIFFPLLVGLAACDDNSSGDSALPPGAKDPATASRVIIDRFSEAAGKLMVRSASNGLPMPGAPINFDMAPFITRGLGPQGQRVAYYNFDVQNDAPAPIYVLFKAGESMPLPGQLNIIDVVPGEAGYSDFWRMHKVTVPAGYVPNSVTSLAEITSRGFLIEPTTTLVNCPVVPAGSTATTNLTSQPHALTRGWYRDQIVTYFSFEEKALMGNTVPVSPIYVTFNVNPDVAGGGPASGFKMEAGSDQTHNVVATLPSDAAYSPLWLVNVYDSAAFASVSDLATAMSAPQKAQGVAKVNCPIVSTGDTMVPPAVPTESAALKSFLMSKGYMSFKAEAAVHPSAGPHGKVRTFVNDVLAMSWAQNRAQHPVGAAAVKELYSGEKLVGWAVLVKTALDQGEKSFFWYEIINDSVVISANDAKACSGCHSAGKDYVLTPPL